MITIDTTTSALNASASDRSFDQPLASSAQKIATPDDPADMVLTLHISGNTLVRILKAAQARARYHGNVDLLALIDAARDVLASQCAAPQPLPLADRPDTRTSEQRRLDAEIPF